MAAAALLLAAWCSAPAGPVCDVPVRGGFHAADDSYVVCREPVLAGSEDCALLLEGKAAVERLRAAAGLPPALLGFMGSQAWFPSYEAGVIDFSLRFARANPDAGFQLAILAHEAVHAMQEAEGLRLRWPAQGPLKIRAEAQADANAVYLLQRLGYPLDAFRRAFERWAGCSAVESPRLEPSDYYPAMRQRRLNILEAERRGGVLLPFSEFDDSGRLRGAQPRAEDPPCAG